MRGSRVDPFSFRFFSSVSESPEEEEEGRAFSDETYSRAMRAKKKKKED